MLALFAAAIVWQQFNSVFENADGHPVPLLNPMLWSFWLPYFLLLLALEAIFLVVTYRAGSWKWSAVWANVALNALFAVPQRPTGPPGRRRWGQRPGRKRRPARTRRTGKVSLHRVLAEAGPLRPRPSVARSGGRKRPLPGTFLAGGGRGRSR